MHNFKKNLEQTHHKWWGEELTILERSDVKQSFFQLEEAGTVHRGNLASTTDNLLNVLAHLLDEKSSYYSGKIDTKHDPTCHKYD